MVALLIDESGQKFARRELEEDSGMTVWWGTRVEYLSALARRERDGSIDEVVARVAIAPLRRLFAEWHEVLPTNALRNLAERMLRVHVLRVAGAFQLAAALTAADDDPSVLAFVSLDERLKGAAAREGFRVR